MTNKETSLPTGAVTFLFTDIEGSTQLWERNPEAMEEAMGRHDSIVGDTIAASGGVVFKTVGDEFDAAFADWIAALSAAISIQAELGRVEWGTDSPIKVRIGVHTGTATLRDRDYSGPTLNRVSRLMSAGHGGQVLVSAATRHLLGRDIPEGLELRSLGTHHLRDLDRPEEIFQAVVDGLPEVFPPLRTVQPESSQPATRARAALQAKKWEEAVDLLERLEGEKPLGGSEHEMLANAFWWLGRHDEMTARFESAHNAFLSEQNAEGAAMAAIQLAEAYHHALAPDVSRAWERRAERLLEESGESVAKGHLLRWQTVRLFDGERDVEAALELSARVMDIARAHGDGNLEVLALQDRGRLLVASGQMEEGMALMDEAMLGAVAGDVTPVVVGRSFCNMLAVCDQTGDIRRAGEWSDAAERWCSENEQAPYPGVCRIFKAELLWHKGEWVRAESEVMRASTELGILRDVVGEAWYQYGEMRLRVGDDVKAEEAFQEALARGREPVPGYALLLARRGDLASGIDLLERTLREPTLTPLDRARFLPAYIELTLEAGRVEDAERATTELEGIAETTRSDYFTAQADSARAGIALVREEIDDAIDRLRRALRTFTGLGLPFEAAQIHAHLAHAYRADGADTLARIEAKTALAEFDRLGATVEASRLGGYGEPA